jgi:hypothetical protein
MEPIKSFEELNVYLGSIPYIQYGGCAIATLFQYMWLKNEDASCKVKILYLYREYNEYMYEENQASLKGIKGEYHSCSHAVLYYKGRNVDCSNVNFDISTGSYTKGLLIDSVDFVLKTLNNLDAWNNKFERDVWIPKMEKRIGIKLGL